MKSKKANEKHTKRHKDLTWFSQSTYVHKGDEKSTINMRVQIIERNNFNQFTQNTGGTQNSPP